MNLGVIVSTDKVNWSRGCDLTDFSSSIEMICEMKLDQVTFHPSSMTQHQLAEFLPSDYESSVVFIRLELKSRRFTNENYLRQNLKMRWKKQLEIHSRMQTGNVHDHLIHQSKLKNWWESNHLELSDEIWSVTKMMDTTTKRSITHWPPISRVSSKLKPVDDRLCFNDRSLIKEHFYIKIWVWR